MYFLFSIDFACIFIIFDKLNEISFKSLESVHQLISNLISVKLNNLNNL